MPFPLAIAAPAAVAGYAYLDAKLGIQNDINLIGSSFKCGFLGMRREKKDRLNHFYRLEDHALSSHSNRVLLIFEGRQWTYREVYDRALSYGSWLKQKHDVKAKEIVAVDFINSEQFIFLWFGLWSIGAKPAFINYNLTSKALSHCIRVSTAQLVLVDPGVAENVTHEVKDELKNVQFIILSPELQVEAASVKGVRQPDSERSEEKLQNLSMLIYTSGTTGLPKPAIVSWNKVITGANIVPWWLNFKTTDIFYSCMPLYHSSAAILGFCMVVDQGATYSLGRKFSTKTFWDDIRASNATVMQYVGETCRYLLAAPPQFDPVTGENLDRKNKVRAAFGNGLRPEIWDRFKERFDIEAIGEFYSATEGVSGAWNFSRNNFSKGAIGRLGFFGRSLVAKSSAIIKFDMANEKPYRDPQTGFCIRIPPSSSEAGEMLYLIDSANIEKSFQGYFQNQGSTESKVIRDVFVKGDAYFRSGDLISHDAEGRVYFSDRIGDTYRWKSENVSTAEVSEALSSHPAIHEANVYGVQLPHHDGRAGCAALVLANEPNEKFLKELATLARGKLPRYAVPLFLRRRKEMQVTGTNKQQKHSLREEGVDVGRCGDDELFWLKGDTYVKFGKREWDELNGGSVKL